MRNPRAELINGSMPGLQLDGRLERWPSLRLEPSVLGSLRNKIHQTDPRGVWPLMLCLMEARP